MRKRMMMMMGWRGREKCEVAIRSLSLSFEMLFRSFLLSFFCMCVHTGVCLAVVEVVVGGLGKLPLLSLICFSLVLSHTLLL